MGFFSDLSERFFGAPKEKPDYSAELEKVKKDYDRLKVLMIEWRKKKEESSAEYYENRIQVLKNEIASCEEGRPVFHPIATILVSRPGLADETFKIFIEQLELAMGDTEDAKAAADYVERTKEEIRSLLPMEVARLEREKRGFIEASQKVVDWPAVKANLLNDIKTQKRVLDIYIPKEGEEEAKRKWFTEERLKSLKSSSLSYPARLVWTVGRGQEFIDRYLNLHDQIIAADEESRKNLEVELKSLENEIDSFLTKEFFRIKQKYSYLNIAI